MFSSESSSGSFRFMGVTSSSKNSAVFVSDKDLMISSSSNNNNMDPAAEFSLLEHVALKPLSVQERDKEEEDKASCADHEEDQKQLKRLRKLKKVEIVIPNSCKGSPEKVLDDDDDDSSGLRTPTSTDHKMVVLECPGAPKKRKSRPTAAKKRKATCCEHMQQIILPDDEELESLFFPTHLVADLGKIKRVKQCPTG